MCTARVQIADCRHCCPFISVLDGLGAANAFADGDAGRAVPVHLVHADNLIDCDLGVRRTDAGTAQQVREGSCGGFRTQSVPSCPRVSRGRVLHDDSGTFFDVGRARRCVLPWDASTPTTISATTIWSTTWAAHEALHLTWHEARTRHPEERR